MSVGKASIKRAASADKKTAPAAVKQETKEVAKEVVVETTAPVKTSASSKAPAKTSASSKTPAKKTPTKPAVKKTPAASVKKTEPKAAFGAVALTEDMPYYLL